MADGEHVGWRMGNMLFGGWADLKPHCRGYTYGKVPMDGSLIEGFIPSVALVPGEWRVEGEGWRMEDGTPG